MATAAEKEALGLKATASDTEVFGRIAELVAASEQFATAPAASERRVLGIIAKGATPFRRGTYIVPNDHLLILDESKMDPAHVLSIDEEANIIKFRSSDPFTPEADVERYKRS